MAFEQVDVNRLRNSLNACKNSINYSTSKDLISEISNTDVWISDSQKVLDKALNKLVSVRYKQLEQQLADYQSITNKIEEYQNLQKENQKLHNENDVLRCSLYDYSNYHQIINQEVQQQINNNNNKINSNNMMMSSIKNSISSLL